MKKNFDDIPDDIELTREQFFGKFFRSIKRDPASGGELKTKCLACFKIFSSKNRLFHAMHNHALDRPFKCELCPQKFFISSKRVWHMSRFHPEDYKCSLCHVQFDRAYQFVDHMQEEHAINLNIPLPDAATINVPSDVMRYTKKITATRTLLKQKRLGIVEESPVESPSASLDSFALLSCFLEEESLKCSECHEEFESGRSLRIHMRNHSNGGDIKPFIVPEKPKIVEYTHECNICFKKFSAPFALNAHKKFKHGTDASGAPLAKRRKIDKERPKFDVECDMCEFTAHRRDYVEHHVKNMHKPEFHCRHCARILSNFNIYVHHMSEYHPHVDEDLQRYHKCPECHKAFKMIENMKLHLENKHRSRRETPDNYCKVCCVVYKDAAGFEIHNQNHVHKNMVKFMERKFNDGDSWEDMGETEDFEFSVVSDYPEEDEEEPTAEEETCDPFQKMLERKLRSYEKSKSSSEEDKLDYLNFMQAHNGVYTCGICGKMKTVRKHMLHHLKQHSEVPTFQCEHCPEKFVFKRKYEKHLLDHQNDTNVDEHPKFQEILPAKNEIKCQICQMTFKLTIMLNRHNSTWHSEDNELRELSMTDQKTKKEELAPIKLLRCKHCLQAFIKPLDLKEHLKVKHNSESMDQPPDEAVDAALRCDKCKLTFEEKKFLENHQKFFCVHRQVKSEGEATKNVINEQ
jgi:KRAB domain-containing zinc finger protein